MMVFFTALALVGALGMRSSARADVLYIGDEGDESVKRFDASSGTPLDPLLHPFITQLDGPRGLLFVDGTLLVVNQNVNLNVPGEVRSYDAQSGAFQGYLVPSTDHDAPFVPRGAVLSPDGAELIVATLSTASGKSSGRLLRYSTADGSLLGSSSATGVANKEFHPRGVVFGPDGLLYVSIRSAKKDGLGGGVLRYDSQGSFVDVFISDDGGVGHLNRPEGVVFGPDGNLYITSFRADPSDTDSIRVYSAQGLYLRSIDLYHVSPVVEPRAFAQALLFGPNGRLFVPISNTGEVRAYNVATGTYQTFVSGGPAGRLIQPWYLTFTRTNPSTLAYGP
jgi:DNA-binding beta-propeller fold protein YncE